MKLGGNDLHSSFVRLVITLPRNVKYGLTGWVLTATVLLAWLSMPFFFILARLFEPANDIWVHVASTLLPGYVLNTLVLITGVSALTLIIGVSTAWLVTAYRFPGQAFFRWALILPLAIPTYIGAFAYAGVFDLIGPINRLVQSALGPQAIIDIMTPTGLVLILSFVLYPYIFLITRSAFELQSNTLLEAARLHGKGRVKTFFRVTLPLARPAIIGGLLLVILEVCNDYGAAKYFGVDTVTTGIFRAWFSFGDAETAIRLSAFLMVICFTLVVLERLQRGRTRFVNNSKEHRTLEYVSLSRGKAVLATSVCLLVFVVGFAIPASQLTVWSLRTAAETVDGSFLTLTLNSFVLAASAAFLTVCCALIISYATRVRPGVYMQTVSRLSVLGYSIPGAVIAIGVMLPLVGLDRAFGNFVGRYLDVSPGLVLSGSLFAVLFAYLVRFLALAFNTTDSGLQKKARHLDEASRTLGMGALRSLFKVTIPSIKNVLLAALIIVFVDVVKELPLTLILRPFNFDTLATKTFELASDEFLAESASPALLIIAIGLLPTFLIDRFMRSNGAENAFR